MGWVCPAGFEPRPLVLLEDQLYHTEELLSALQAERPGLLRRCTAWVAAHDGPDTTHTVVEWLRRYPDLQVAAAVRSGDLPAPARDRLRRIDRTQLADATACARAVAGLLRPGGVLVQDVQLTTLTFVPPARWWETIYLAATVRGLFGDRPPAVRFMSNKRGYAATFGRELLDAGFDPRAVLDKGDVLGVVVPTIAGLVDEAFPLAASLRWPAATRGTRVAWADADALAAAVDLVLWDTPSRVELGGRLVATRDGERLALRPDGQEAASWRALVDDRLDDGPGVPVVELGRRVAPPDAARAECINLAARHAHGLRARLATPSALATQQHAYRLGDELSVARVRPAGPR